MNFPILKRLMVLKMKESLQFIARAKSGSNEYSSFSRVYNFRSSSLVDLLFHLSLGATYSAETLTRQIGLPHRTHAYDQFIFFLLDRLAEQLERDLLEEPAALDLLMQDQLFLQKIKSVTAELKPLKSISETTNETIAFLESIVSNNVISNVSGKKETEK
jgi:hypothetical protein